MVFINRETILFPPLTPHWEVLDITFLLVFQAKNVFLISSEIFEIFRIIYFNLTVWIDSKSNVNKIVPIVETKAYFYGHSARITLVRQE